MTDLSNAPALDRKTLDKIRKLLALAKDGGATEGEANAAMEAAQAIMAKNNLTMAVLEAAGKDAGEGSKRLKTNAKGKAAYSYQQQLMATIGDVNHCAVLITAQWRGSRRIPTGYALIGREANVAAALGMFDYLNSSLERIVTPHLESNAQRLSKWAISFKEGAARRLEERLRERFEQAQREQSAEARRQQQNADRMTEGGGVLVVVMEDYDQAERDANTDLRFGWEPGTTARQRMENAVQVQERRKAEELRRANLTEEERAAEDAEKAKDYAKWEKKWQRRSDAYWNKRDLGAYLQGQKAADSIGLDQQVKSGSNAQRLK